MEHRKLTEEQFDTLWQRAEAEEHATRLAAEYPAWRRRQRRTTGIAAAVLAVAAVTVTLLSSPTATDYEHIYCNHDGVADNYWVAMADELLMSV